MDRVKRAVASSWGWKAVGLAVRTPGVTVLMYHRISGTDHRLPGLPVEVFAGQMRWLRDRCDPVRPEQLVERAERPNRARPAVLVTFDDGYRDYHDLAYPILKKLDIPATVFLATSCMDEGGMIWTDQVQWAALSTSRDRIRLPWERESEIFLESPGARERLGARARAYLKGVSDEERRELLPRLLAELGEAPVPERQMLNWDEVRRTMDLTSFGGHTHTHPILSRLPHANAEREIRTCRDRIAAETGQAPTTFAYPNGQPSDYTRETKELVRSAGFSLAFSTTEGIAGLESDWLAIRRLPGDARSVHDFAWATAGLSR
jgi:peptidoglycan/xylan/chitin deacetylase (PgdA/CDA1 family)